MRYPTELDVIKVIALIFLFIACLMLLPGCFQSRSDETTDQQREKTSRWSGTIALPIPATAQSPASMLSIPIDLVQRETETTSTVAHTEGKSGIDADAIASNAANLAIAGIKQLFPVAGAMIPTPQAPGTDWLSVGGAALALVGGAATKHVLDMKTKKELAADRDEGWKLAQEAQRRAEEYALQLPPKAPNA